MATPQNLLFILAESHGPRLLGRSGDPIVKTPNLDRLAARGTHYRNTYCTSPLCVPSRSSLATGLYPHQSGYWDNSLTFHGERQSWMRRLREAGHEVTAIGKLHFRSEEDDNGFSEEIDTMHLLEGLGELIGLLRCDGEEQPREGLWDLYTNRAGVGETSPYQDYDRRITAESVRWLADHKAASDKPWALCVHYVSAHPPFVVPQRLLDLYPPDALPLPVQFSPEDRPYHPALVHLRQIFSHDDKLDEDVARLMIACYFSLITHLDEQVGEVLAALDDSGLSESTRVVYTADHGFNFGNQYILGMANLYDRAVSVPLIMAGSDIEQGGTDERIVSHVDLYQTILEGAGEPLDGAEHSMSGRSLLSKDDPEDTRLGFAEYHAAGSKNAAYMLRDGADKLIYHVDMPAQLFNLADDPDETRNLVADRSGLSRATELEVKLRDILDPEDTDRRAKAAQRHRIEELGGKEEIMRLRSGFTYSPPPGADWRKV